MSCFPTCLRCESYVLGGGSFFCGLGGFDFSYDEVKRAGRRLLIGFLSP